MPEIEVLVSEQCGSSGNVIAYGRRGHNQIAPILQTTPLWVALRSLVGFFRELLLPHGYPDSVSPDYLQYQVWDTAQAFCSTITGAFTTRAVLKGVGVGDAKANALSAAITWILKDGTGMVGRIIFAWWKGNNLDSDCKKWRLFADILNDLAMIFELFVPWFQGYSMQILCTTSAMKSIVGVAGGATRASITHHQAVRDNMAEISAKDGSQETVVNLVASALSIYLLQMFSGNVAEWSFIAALIILHLTFNYLAVKSLIFDTFNDQRMALVLKTYFNVGTVLNPVKVNKNETVILGFGLKVKKFCGFKIIVGESIRNVLKKYTWADFTQILSVYKDRNYFLLVDLEKRKLYVSMLRGETVEEMVAAYFHATCLAVATSIYNGIGLDIYSKRQLRHPTPITRINTFMKSYERAAHTSNIPFNHLMDLNDFVKQEYAMFETALHINGEWRCDWESDFKKDR
ncbi:unnamed protein product [Callosobruchus maculatus]|uniref:DUF647 domain-containing protein n=1 Tax=Callosobruchus maculatus TaxID=64391 RepID=A0A653CR01_CALMS|nr:unnamed protein product [Callosobruchus maculatus]